MIKIGLTGSIASGKSIASKIISKKKGPVFNADKIVNKLYKHDYFKKLIIKKLKFNSKKKFKSELQNSILKDESVLKKLEKIIHPLVRKKMITFLEENKNKKLSFCEIPLLVESKLTKYFDVIIFIKSKKIIRLKRYLLKGGDAKLFLLLNKHQFADAKKMKFCDHIVVNNNSLSFLKKQLYNIIKLYE